MAERDPLEALAEEPAGMRPRAVIMDSKRPACFAHGSVSHCDMAQIAAFRGIAAERPALAICFGVARLEHGLAAVRRREPVRPHRAAGEIVGGEFPDRQAIGKTRGERIRRVMVLVPALEGRDPQRLGAAARDRGKKPGRRGIETLAQTARRRLAKPRRLQPNERRRRQCLKLPAPHPPGMGRALPGPQRRALRYPGRQVQHENPGASRAGPQGGDAAGDDLVIGMRRQDEDPARRRHVRWHHVRPVAAASCHTGSKSSVRTSPQLGTCAST